MAVQTRRSHHMTARHATALFDWRIARYQLASLPFLLAGCPAPDPAREPPAAESPAMWLFGEVPAQDAIRETDSEEDLRRRFGVEQVRSDTIWVGEGFFEIGTAVYPDDPHRRLEIQWSDTITRARPELVRVGPDSSVWHIAPGAGIGTSLRELEVMNGRPFSLYGFGWDYEGTVATWEGGHLQRWGDRVILRLAPPARDRTLERQVLGEQPYPSDHPAMRELAPRVYAMLVRPR